MHMKKLLCSLLCIGFLWVPVVQAVAPKAEMQICQRAGAKGQAAENDCYLQLAYKYQDASVCDFIQFSIQSTTCRRTILLVKPDLWSLFSYNFILIYAIFAWFAIVLLTPPRGAYVIGAIVGLVTTGFYWFFTTVAQPEFMQVLIPYVPWLLVPTNGLQLYSPDWYNAWPAIGQIAFVQSLFYSAVIGLLLQQTRRTIVWAIIFATVCIMLSVRPEAFFYIFTSIYAGIKSLFSV